MKTPLLALFALTLVSAAHAEDMIDVGNDGGIESPYRDAQGQPLRAYPAVVATNEAGEVTGVHTLSRSEACALYGTEDGGCFGSRGPVAMAGYESLSGAGVRFGWVFGTGNKDGDMGWTRQGLVLEGTLGHQGAKAGVGYLFEKFFLIFPVGADIKASAFQSWGAGFQDYGTSTYVGGEVDLMVWGARLTFGVFQKVAGSARAEDLRFNLGAGLGF